ncbi:MAG: hypothetical protein EZS28_009576 [Streblomastix strix]|uniref:Uncharacterized protein n=1 Tax=Streblomastix strix TaxID=222440 RepID=A0A5J4WIT5_9EUKA|nr:MAG: hypothetical protein EZS28_009576 [Streblomastix strix]
MSSEDNNTGGVDDVNQWIVEACDIEDEIDENFEKWETDENIKLLQMGKKNKLDIQRTHHKNRMSVRKWLAQSLLNDWTFCGIKLDKEFQSIIQKNERCMRTLQRAAKGISLKKWKRQIQRQTFTQNQKLNGDDEFIFDFDINKHQHSPTNYSDQARQLMGPPFKPPSLTQLAPAILRTLLHVDTAPLMIQRQKDVEELKNRFEGNRRRIEME